VVSEKDGISSGGIEVPHVLQIRLGVVAGPYVHRTVRNVLDRAKTRVGLISGAVRARAGGIIGTPAIEEIAMTDAFICDAVRTPIGRYGGALANVRADDLAAMPIAALLARNPSLDPGAIDEVLLGCANQAGEDNRNVARMAVLLAGLPVSVPGATINRLCGSGLDAVAVAARAIKAGEAGLIVAGGVESMTRAPFVMPKADSAFSRNAEVFDTTIGWRFVNPALIREY